LPKLILAIKLIDADRLLLDILEARIAAAKLLLQAWV
jgi:hypothetical protein